MITLLPKRKAPAEVVWKPVPTFLTRMSTVLLAKAWPKPRAAGVLMRIWFAVTDRTVASRLVPAALKKTWTGATKPVPLIVTRVPPSLVPEAGVTEKIAGWVPPPSA
jgi:hypothetical protein